MHLNIDAAMEKTAGIGTTKRGIGPSYTTKMLRKGLRVGDLINWEMFVKKYKVLYGELMEYFKFDAYDMEKELSELKKYRGIMIDNKMIIDCVDYIHQERRAGKRVLVEGANATMLDVDHGTYPYVTSSSTNIGGACTGLGIPPNAIEARIGVVKAYTTRVGGGPFPTELKDKMGTYLQDVGHEYGATTGRKRRCGWLDLNVVRYANKINDFSSLIITKLDILDQVEEIKIGMAYKIKDQVLPDLMPSTIDELEQVECVYKAMPGWKTDISKVKIYKDLPQNAKNYIEFIESSLGIPIAWIGVGAGREEIIQK